MRESGHNVRDIAETIYPGECEEKPHKATCPACSKVKKNIRRAKRLIDRISVR